MRKILIIAKKTIPVKVKKELKLIFAPLRRVVAKILSIKNKQIKDVSIISNNCIGADISRKLYLKYNSPTVNMQVLPGQFSKFISNLKYYLNIEPIEVLALSEVERCMLKEMYGIWEEDKIPFPIGRIDDILLCFQHYNNFEDAVRAWNRRKDRVNFKKIGYILVADVIKYKEDIMRFYGLNIENKLLFLTSDYKEYPEYTSSLVNDNLTEVHRIYCPGHHFMDKDENGISYYERDFNSNKYLREISR